MEYCEILKQSKTIRKKGKRQSYWTRNRQNLINRSFRLTWYLEKTIIWRWSNSAWWNIVKYWRKVKQLDYLARKTTLNASLDRICERPSVIIKELSHSPTKIVFWNLIWKKVKLLTTRCKKAKIKTKVIWILNFLVNLH